MNYPWKIECFLEDLFLGGQWSIILAYRRLSVKSLLVRNRLPLLRLDNTFPSLGSSQSLFTGVWLRVPKRDEHSIPAWPLISCTPFDWPSVKSQHPQVLLKLGNKLNNLDTNLLWLSIHLEP